MLNSNIDLIEELDNVSRIHVLDRDDIDTIMVDFAKRILPCLRIERMNVWLFNPEKTAIISIGEYDTRTKELKKNSVLQKKDFPVYFAGLQENKIIIAEDIYSHPLTLEFTESYSKPNDIYSLLDIPLRIGGELIGVMCFEKTGLQKHFSQNEISFCLSLSFVFASNMESRHRRAAQTQLEKMLNEKELLIKEINHRVKNNFSILISLMRISKNKASSQEAQILLEEYEQRIFSMLKIHDMLNQKHHYSHINFADYLIELMSEFKHTYPQFEHAIDVDIQPNELVIDTNKTIHLGLIISEILLNSIKHASTTTKDYKIRVELKEIDHQLLYFKIGDNGNGFDFNQCISDSSLGLPLIKDLIDSLSLKTVLPNAQSSYYIFEICA